MRYPIAQPFNMAELNKPLPSTIIQEQVADGIHIYSMGKGTNMSPEVFQFYKVIFVKRGKIRMTLKEKKDFPTYCELGKDEGIITMKNVIIGIEALEDCVYGEVMLGQTVDHNIVDAGVVFDTRKIGRYVPQQIYRVNLIISGFVQIMIDCADVDAPAIEKTLEASALIFVHEGDGVIVCDGKEIEVHKDDSIRFVEGNVLSIRAKDGPFKIGIINFFA